MAITFIQQPAPVCFAGNPIIFKAKTSLEDKAFLRIVLVCEVYYTPMDATEDGTYTEKYTYLLGEDKVGVFNIASTLHQFIRRRIEYGMEGGNYLRVDDKRTHVSFSVTAKEVYVDGINEIEGDSVTASGFVAITGGLTDWELMNLQAFDAEEYLGGGRILSRKPNGELLVSSMPCLIPVVSSGGGTILEAKSGERVVASIKSPEEVWAPSTLQLELDGCISGDVINVSFGNSSCTKYVVPTSSMMRTFYFLNGFGLPETANACMLESLTYKTSSDTYSIPSEIGMRGYGRVLNYAEPSTAEFSMSSGFVPREWAEWWIHEFLQTRMAWIVERGSVVPVAIIPDETLKLYDKSKPDMLAVTFKVKYSFRGGTYNRFV